MRRWGGRDLGTSTEQTPNSSTRWQLPYRCLMSVVQREELTARRPSIQSAVAEGSVMADGRSPRAGVRAKVLFFLSKEMGNAGSLSNLNEWILQQCGFGYRKCDEITLVMSWRYINKMALSVAKMVLQDRI